MATQVVYDKIGWMTIQQAAEYLGVSIPGLKYAVALKKQNKANHSFILKEYGNRTLINKKSLDDTVKIIINTPHD